MWDSSLGLVSLNEALSVWLSVLVVVLLASLMMMVLLVLVSLKMLQIFCHNLEPGFGVLKIPVSLSLERAHNSAF